MCVYECMCMNVYAWEYMCVCVWVCVHEYICVCVWVRCDQKYLNSNLIFFFFWKIQNLDLDSWATSTLNWSCQDIRMNQWHFEKLMRSDVYYKFETIPFLKPNSHLTQRILAPSVISGFPPEMECHPRISFWKPKTVYKPPVDMCNVTFHII